MGSPDRWRRLRACMSGIRAQAYDFGAPELVVEVSFSSRKKDLGPKKADYERAGVREYVCVGIDSDEVRWFVLREGRFVEMPPGPDGLLRSEVFPGLWLDPAALLRNDGPRVTEVLRQGLTSPEHAAFVTRLSTPPTTTWITSSSATRLSGSKTRGDPFFSAVPAADAIETT